MHGRGRRSMDPRILAMRYRDGPRRVLTEQGSEIFLDIVTAVGPLCFGPPCGFATGFARVNIYQVYVVIS